MAEAGIQPPEQMWRDWRTRKAALDAARARSRGKSQAEARDIYVAELRARGLTVSPDRILDQAAEGLAASPGERIVLLGRALPETVRGIKDLYRIHRP